MRLCVIFFAIVTCQIKTTHLFIYLLTNSRHVYEYTVTQNVDRTYRRMQAVLHTWMVRLCTTVSGGWEAVGTALEACDVVIHATLRAVMFTWNQNNALNGIWIKTNVKCIWFLFSTILVLALIYRYIWYQCMLLRKRRIYGVRWKASPKVVCHFQSNFALKFQTVAKKWQTTYRTL